MDVLINHNTLNTVLLGGTHVIDTGLAYNFLHYPAIPNKSTGMCSSRYDNERELVSMFTMEAWNSFGVKVLFYRTTYDVNRDKVWGEDNNRYIAEEWQVMSYFQLPKENKIWSKFGIDGVNDFSMFMSKEHFQYETDNYIPQIGDLVFTKYNDKLYEITEVKEESPQFLLSKQYAWELIVRQAKMESSMSLLPSLSASPISKFYKVDDIFDIRNQIDIEKDNILYNPQDGERSNNDPFGNW